MGFAKQIPKEPRNVLSTSYLRVIADMHRANQGPHAIARALGRHRSTISRELARKTPAATTTQSIPSAWLCGASSNAQAARTNGRASLARLGPVDATRALVARIISTQLRLGYPDEPAMQISHERLYQCIYG
jgi:IS30 family transposase